jgi:hypothetical protein
LVVKQLQSSAWSQSIPGISIPKNESEPPNLEVKRRLEEASERKGLRSTTIGTIPVNTLHKESALLFAEETPRLVRLVRKFYYQQIACKTNTAGDLIN